MPANMVDTLYLTVNSRGVRNMTKRRPSLKGDEVAVKIKVVMDQRHFRRPFAEATITVDESHIIEPTAEVTVEDPPEIPEE